MNIVIAHHNKKERLARREEELARMNKYQRQLALKKPADLGVDPTDKRNFSTVGMQATEVSRRLDRLALTNPEAATRLSGKCYKLVALTDLIAAGEIDPTSAGAGEPPNTIASQAGAEGLKIGSRDLGLLGYSSYGETDIVGHRFP
jgi:hypothetical protein